MDIHPITAVLGGLRSLSDWQIKLLHAAEKTRIVSSLSVFVF